MENETKHTFNPLLMAFGLLAVVATVAAGFFYYKYQVVNKLLSNNQPVSATEAKQIVDKISKFYNLPKDETPNIASVLDVTKLKDQPFFKDAKNDDKILIYAKAGLAILYRPSENKIINISPVMGASPTPSATTTASPEPTSTPKKTQ